MRKTTPRFAAKHQREPFKPREDGFLIESWSAVSDYLRHDPQKVLKLYIADTFKDELLNPFKKVLGQTQIVREKSDSELLRGAAIAGRVRIPVRSEDELLRALEKENRFLALDHVQDPRNLGAVLRSAAFFGYHHIILPKDRQVHLTDVVSKTAMGGTALLQIYVVTNLTRILQKVRENDIWIIGLDGEQKTQLSDVHAFERQCLVMGAEGKGISSLVSRQCDVCARIPGAERAVESLNVSVAAGIAMYHLGANGS